MGIRKANFQVWHLLGTRRSLVNSFLERNQLLRPERLVVDLRSGFNEVLQVCSKRDSVQNQDACPNYTTHLVKKLRKCTNSQWSASSTLTTPQRFLRPRTVLPSMITLFSEPTTANGMVCYQIKTRDKQATTITQRTHPDAFVKMNFFLIVLVCVKGIRTNIIENQLFPDLQGEKDKNKNQDKQLSNGVL